MALDGRHRWLARQVRTEQACRSCAASKSIYVAGQLRLLWFDAQLCDVYGVANDTAEKAIQ